MVIFWSTETVALNSQNRCHNRATVCVTSLIMAWVENCCVAGKDCCYPCPCCAVLRLDGGPVNSCSQVGEMDSSDSLSGGWYCNICVNYIWFLILSEWPRIAGEYRVLNPSRTVQPFPDMVLSISNKAWFLRLPSPIPISQLKIFTKKWQNLFCLQTMRGKRPGRVALSGKG